VPRPRLARASALPASVRSSLDLRMGERVLASAPLLSRGWVVATTRGLHLVDPAGASERHGWDRVAAAVWSDTASMLQVTWVDSRRQLLLEFAGSPGFLPEVIRERVEASVVISRRIDAGGRRGVRVAVRREGPGAELSMQVVADRGVDLSDPGLAARVEVELADLREQTGLSGGRSKGGSKEGELPRLDSNQRPSD
jgi:hypothetical protein